MSKKHIAFIYEGERAERQLIENLCANFFDAQADVSIIAFPAKGNIYMLWTRLKADEFETNVIDVVREMNPDAKKMLENKKTSGFSEVYLFFDYDAHNNNIPREYTNMDIVLNMLQTFDNETELGKLYVSYPMIESLREISVEKERYQTLSVPIQNNKYKNYVSVYRDFQNFSRISFSMWQIACRASACRANLIVQKSDTLPDYDSFINCLTQERIYRAQLQYFVKPKQEVGVINGVPIFLLEYFDNKFWKTVMGQDFQHLPLGKGI